MKRNIALILCCLFLMEGNVSIAATVSDSTARSTEEVNIKQQSDTSTMLSTSDSESQTVESTTESKILEDDQPVSEDSSPQKKQPIEESSSSSLPEVEGQDETDGFDIPRGRSDLAPIEQPGAAVAYSAMYTTPLTIYPDKNKNTPRLDFVDVSSHNGNISVNGYKVMKKFGVKAVVVKLTESTSYRNPFAKSQIENAKKAGLRVHVYHYSWFTSKATAEREAAYFVKYAKELGIGKDSFFFNDIEEPSIAGKADHTSTSLQFVDKIKELGYPNTQHYIGRHWVNSQLINPQRLGYQNCWIAQYPYTPTSATKWNTEFGSWQWSSTVVFPGVATLFDVSIDYSGILTKSGENPGKPSPVKKYLTITNDSLPIYSDFNWNTKGSTKNLYKKTFYAKEKYNHSNGTTYLSIFDSANKWIGYVESDAGKLTDGPQGTWMNYKKYGKFKNNKVKVFSGFDWKQKTVTSSDYSTEQMINGTYHHFNGSKYLSIFRKNGKWIGYVKSTDITVSPDQGEWQKHNAYITFTKNDIKFYGGFNWSVKNISNGYKYKTLRINGQYSHINGKVYYSIYDNKSKWVGYVQAGQGYERTNPGGLKYDKNIYLMIKNKNVYLYKDFSGNKKGKVGKLSESQYVIKEQYNAFNGITYFALKNSQNKTLGYLRQSDVTVLPAQGEWQKHNAYMTFTKNGITLYSGFDWKVKNKSDNRKYKTFRINGQYEHMNGKTYYSIYDNRGNWLGYMQAGQGYERNNPGGLKYNINKKVKIKNKNVVLYSNFTGSKKGKAGSIAARKITVREQYNAHSGIVYYAVKNSANKFIGYVKSTDVLE